MLLSSHILAEVEALSDRVSIVRDGRVVETGTLDQLRHLSRTVITAELSRPPEGIQALDGVHGTVVDRDQAHVRGRRRRARRPAAGPRAVRRHRSDESTAHARGPVPAALLSGAHLVSRFTGTPALTRFALRRDRILLPIWILLIVMMAGFSASASADLFPTLASRVEASLALNTSQAFVSLLGRVYDPTSLGALSLIKLTTFGTAFIAVFAIMLVVRHTRREEENGRLELLGATVVGRQAALTAALLVALLTMGAIGVLTPLVLIAAGLPAEGAWAFGAAWAATGITFAAIAAVAAQLTVSARTANGIAFTVLALAYTLRAVGDTAGDLSGPGFASWLSPIGWAQQVRPFAGDRWWVLGLLMLLTALTLVAAYALAARRDLGAGLLADRPGPAEAEPRLASPLALAWRLQRAPLAAWAAGYVLLGFVYGNMASSVNSFLTSAQFEEYLRKLGGPGSLTDAFFSAEYGFLAIVTAAYGVSVALRLRTEEESGHAELLLATSISRTRWLASHVVVAVLGTTDPQPPGGPHVGRGQRRADRLHRRVRRGRRRCARLPAGRVGARRARGHVVRVRPAPGAVGVGRSRRLRAARGVRHPAAPADVGGRPVAVHARAQAARCCDGVDPGRPAPARGRGARTGRHGGIPRPRPRHDVGVPWSSVG